MIAQRPRDSRLSNASKLRFKFILKSLLTFFSFVLLTYAQFHLTKSCKEIEDFIVNHLTFCIGFFCMALFHMLLFVFVENIRFTSILNWLTGILIVEFLIISITRTAINYKLSELFGCIGVVFILVLIFFTIAVFTKHDFTLDVIILFVVSYVLFIGTIYFLTLYINDHIEYTLYIASGIITFVVCMFLLYHCQCIVGGYYAEIRTTDCLLAALILYVDFYILFLVSLNVVPPIIRKIQQQN